MSDDVGHPAAESLADPRHHEAYAYWRSKCVGGRLPRRRDIDPADIPRLLPHVLLVDIAGGRYRYRVIGTECVREHGRDSTGQYLDEVIPGRQYKAHVLRLYDECVHERRPVYSESLFLAPRGMQPQRHLKVLFLPLSDDGERVDKVLVVQLFFYIEPNIRQRHFLDAPPHREIVHAAL
ncbi:MAG: PAS domain-containing protein [Alphaproteobacteria bacterium]|nr:PAS domain-containing protein [Alphaproteobacteria bacterium]